jgi:hypothetical protein
MAGIIGFFPWSAANGMDIGPDEFRECPAWLAEEVDALTGLNGVSVLPSMLRPSSLLALLENNPLSAMELLVSFPSCKLEVSGLGP